MKHLELTLLFFLFSFVFAKDTLYITYGHSDKSPVYQKVSRFVQEIQKRSEILPVLSLQYQTYGRSRLSLIEGSTDGDLGRSLYIYTFDDPVILVPTPVFFASYYGFTLQSYIDTVSVFPSKSARYLIVLTSTVCKNWAEKQNLTYEEVRDYSSIVKMLSMGRGDILVASDLLVMDSMFQDYNIVKSEKPLFHEPIYLYLHESNKEYADELDRILKILFEENVAQRIMSGQIE